MTDDATPSWTLWTACLAWSEALVDWHDATAGWTEPTERRAAVMAALAVALAGHTAVSDAAMHPDALGRDVVLTDLYTLDLEAERLHLECIRTGYGPAPGETGAAAHAGLAELTADSPTWQDIVAHVRAVVLAHILAAATSSGDVVRLADRRAALVHHATERRADQQR